MELLVCKFGGSSAATKERIENIAEIIKINKRRRCIVLSAPGKAEGIKVKVTDALISITEKAKKNKDFSKDIRILQKRFESIYFPLGITKSRIEEIFEELHKRVKGDKKDFLRYRDAIVSLGEDFNAKLFAEYLTSTGTKAEYVSPVKAGLIVTGNYGDALHTKEAEKNLGALKKRCEKSIVVFPGFFGITKEGNIATFSRGGSDLTGAILAGAMNASEYENWTDVDGIFSADPRDVENPEQIPALTYKEMRELSYMGFNVFHEEAIKPIIKKMIPIRLRNTNNIANKGTLIVTQRLPSERDVIGISSGKRFCSFTVEKFLMNREKGFGRRLLKIIEDVGLSYEHCPSGVDNISVILEQNQLKPKTANRIVRTIEAELEPDEIRTEFDISLIAVVGEGLVHKIGTLSYAAKSLSDAGVNIHIANQGSSEISMIFGINAEEEKKAVEALYNAFFRQG